MKHVNFLSKSSSQSCGHSSVTLASTVGSQEEFYVSGGNSRGAFTPADVCQTSSVRLNRFTAHRRGTMLKLISILVLIFTFGVSQVWGAAVTIASWTGDERTANSTVSPSSSQTDNSSARLMSECGLSQAGSGGCDGAYFDSWTNDKCIYLTSLSLSGYTSISLDISMRRRNGTCTAYFYASTNGSTYAADAFASKTLTNSCVNYNVSVASNVKAIKIKISGGSGNFWLGDVSLSGTKAASCDVDPTVGVPTLTSIASNSITVSCPSISAGTNCSIDDYGFVWQSGGSDPTISNNKSQVGTNNQSTSYSKALSITVSTGTTYKIKAYAHNGHGNGLSTSSLTVIPQTISFNGNTSTSGSMSTQYVNRNTSTAITSNAFSKTGYTFAGWATSANGDVAYTNGQSVSISSNLSLFAKWNAKQCAITFDKEGGTDGSDNTTATYDAEMETITPPTRTHYIFGGYWDGDNGTGNQYYNADGTSHANWNKNTTSATTLYAKWTAKSYTVTWVVNGTTLSTDQVTYNTTATLPTNPDPASYCGHKFMGWTTVQNHDAATAPSPLITSAPTITGDVTYYAVFGYYEE